MKINTYAISQVVVTIIIVAITIAVAITAVLWISSIAGIYTRVEVVQVINKYASGSSENGWRGKIFLTVKNTGSFDLSITDILINNRPYTYFGDIEEEIPIPLKSGETKNLTIKIDKGELASGTVVEVVLHTSTGTEYYQVVNIPLQLS
ncbi:MAG: DUF4352 domain-containing protein [Candidatus Methanomethylicia archaeon]